MLDERLKNQVIALLIPYEPQRIGIFGSYARGDYRQDSDLDILVAFREGISLLQLVQVQQEISDELGIPVDMVTENSLKNRRLRHYIYQDLIPIFDEEERFDLS